MVDEALIFQNLSTSVLKAMMVECVAAYSEVEADIRAHHVEIEFWSNRYNMIEEELIQRGYYNDKE